MTQHQSATPDQVGYKVGAIPMNLVAGTSDQIETAQSVQGQPYALLRAWQPSSLSYVTLQTDASGNLAVSGGTGGAGSTSVDATLKASTAVVGHVVVDSMPAVSVAGTTTVDANLSSAGSTRLVGMMTVANPTTAVNVANPTTSVTITNPTTSVTVTNPSTAIDATLSSAGSTRLVGQFTVANPTTAVTLTNPATSVTVTNPTTVVDLSSNGSTRTVGVVTVGNPTTSVTLTNPSTAVTVSNPTTAVDLSSAGSTRVVGTVNVSSGVILSSGTQTIGTVAQGSAGSSAAPWFFSLAAGSSANVVGSMALVAGSSGNVIGSVALVAGSSANILGSVVLNSGSTAVTVGSAALLAGSSANTIGAVAQGAGSAAASWAVNSVAFSSAGVARTSVSTTVDIQLIAANANRKALVIANGSTTQTVAIGLTTAAVTTALANVTLYLQPTSQLRFGICGDLPLYTGPIRGINITSTAVAGGVFVSEFS